MLVGNPGTSPFYVEQNNNFPPKDVHFLILRTHEYITVYGKGELRFQVELRLLISRLYHREITLDYGEVDNVIIKVLKNGRRRQKREVRGKGENQKNIQGEMQHWWLYWRKRSMSQGKQCPLGKVRKWIFPRASERNTVLLTS